MSPQVIDPVLLRTDFPELKLHASGKVRDVYQLDSDHLLFVATDRISAFDYVLATGIPHKGRVLTQISLFWFDFLRDLVPNHVVTADVEQYPAAVRKYADQLRGRSMMVKRAEMFPVECVVRGYISGSAWKEYKASGRVESDFQPDSRNRTSCRSLFLLLPQRQPRGMTRTFLLKR